MKIDLPQKKFGGIIPATDPQRLPEDAAQTAENVNLLGGTLDTVKGTTSVKVLDDANQESLYKSKSDTYVLTCGTSGSLATFQAVSDGAFGVEIDGSRYNVSGLDFSGDTDMDDVAQTLEDAMISIYGIAEYDTDHFEFTSGAEWDYLVSGYGGDDTVDQSSYGSNTTNGGDADGWFDGTYSSYGTPAGTHYVVKDYGASGGVKLNTIDFTPKPASAVNYSYFAWYESGGTIYRAPGQVTFTAYGSDDNATWTELGSVTFENYGTAGVATTLTAGSDTVYRYLKISQTFASTGSVQGLVSGTAVIYGQSVNEITDLSTSTYLNGESGTASSDASTWGGWITWEEDSISVARGPVVNDAYARVYWTGEGALRARGTYGTRNVGIDAPASAPTIALADQYSESFSGRTEIVRNDGGGEVTENDDMNLVSETHTDVGYEVVFQMPEVSYASSAATPTLEFQFDIADVSGWQTPSDIGTKTSLTDNGTTYAEIEITAIEGDYSAEESGGTYTWSQRYVTLRVNMNYYLQTNMREYYLYTYVNTLGEESPPSPVSAKVVRFAEERATVTVASSSDTNADKIRIYKSANDSDTSQGFNYLTEIDNTTTTYIDWERDEDLVEAFEHYYAPPEDMHSLTLMANEFFVAAKNNIAYASDANLPFSWPPDYEIALEYKIVGLAAAGNECIVMTEGNPYLITGYTPDSLTVTQLMLNQSCVSSRGIAQVGRMVLYPSPDGYVSVQGGQAQLITEEYIQPQDWSDYNPSTMIASTLNKKLYVKSSSHFLIMDFDQGLSALTTSSVSDVQGMYTDLEDDTLYVIIDDDIHSFNTGSDLEMTFKSKEFKTVKPWRPSCIRVEAEGYPVTLRLYSNGSLQGSFTLSNEQARKVPLYKPETRWAFQLESSNEVRRVQIATSIGELLT